MITVLIVYDHRARAMDVLAAAAAEGVCSLPDTEAWVRNLDQATLAEMAAADAYILGSPNWSGISAKVKEWLDQGEDFWEYQMLVGRPFGTFTAARSRASGNEITLLQMWHPLIANGMIPVGLPWSNVMRGSSNSYYGPVAVGPATVDDVEAARILGRRVAEVARRLDLRGRGVM